MQMSRICRKVRDALFAFATLAIMGAAAAQPSCSGLGYRPEGDYGKVALSDPQSILNTASAQLGTLDLVSRYASNDAYRSRSRAIGRLDVRLSNQCMQTCTATLLPGGHIITAGHCFAPRNSTIRPVEARVVFNHLRPEDLQADVEIYPVEIASIHLLDPVEVDGESLIVDMAVAALDRVPFQIDAALLAETIPEQFASLYMVGHPLGLPKMIALAGCRVESISAFRIFHRCDTVGGSSGSAFFDTRTQQILGIHTDGSGGAGINNSGWLVAGVVSQIRARYGDQFFQEAEVVPEAGWTNPVQGPVAAGLRAGIAAFDGRDWSNALAVFMPLGEADEPAANAYLGRMLADGLGVARDESEALRRYRRAASKGNAIGQFGIGEIYDTGRGVPANAEEALYWFRLSAEQGYAPAQHRLAMRHANLMNGAVGSNQELAQQQEAEMFRWLRAAAEQEYLPALNEMSFRLAWKTLSAADDAARQQLRREGFQYAKRAADLGDAEALQDLGNRYAGGSGVPADGLIARDYFLKALAAGREFANFGLGELYFDGAPGVAINYVKARQYFEASRDAHASATRLGDIYFKGLGVERDHKKALEYYLFAARRSAQWYETYMNISSIYASGSDGVAKDKIAAFQWAVWGLHHSVFDLGDSLANAGKREAVMKQSDKRYNSLSSGQRKKAIQAACTNHKEFGLMLPNIYAACPGEPAVIESAIRYRP